VKVTSSALLLYAGFLLWGLAATYTFYRHKENDLTYVVTLVGIACVLLSFCLGKIEARLDSLEARLKGGQQGEF
jgi:hypothetical protein